jgi:hypothetical protein
MGPSPEQSAELHHRRSSSSWPRIVGVAALAPFTVYGCISAATLLVRPAPKIAAPLTGAPVDCGLPRFSWRADCRTSDARGARPQTADEGPSTTGSIAERTGERSSTTRQNWRDAPEAPTAAGGVLPEDRSSRPVEQAGSGHRIKAPSTERSLTAAGADLGDVEVNYSAAFPRKTVAKLSESPKPPAAVEQRVERAARLPSAEPPPVVDVPRAQGSTVTAPTAPQKAAQPMRQQRGGESVEAPPPTRQVAGERQGVAEPTKSARRPPEEEQVERPANEQPKPSLLRELFTPRQAAAPADVPQRKEEANPAVVLQRPESNQ